MGIRETEVEKKIRKGAADEAKIGSGLELRHQLGWLDSDAEASRHYGLDR